MRAHFSLGLVALFGIIAVAAALALSGSPDVRAAVTITVNSTNDDEVVNGNCTLREAILAANTNTDIDQCLGLGGSVNDLIQFSLGAGTPKIEIAANPLPPITQWVVINGRTGGADRVEINGPGAPFVGGADGLQIDVTGAGTEIRSMVVNNSADDGILILADEVLVVDSIIGLDATGTIPMPNNGFGIQVHSNGNRIGQSIDTANCISNSCDRNVIAASAAFKSNILLDFDATGAFVRGNFIGTDITGTVPILPNQNTGIIDKGIGSTIGGITGTTPGGSCTGECNLISGNSEGGVLITAPGGQSRLLGNFVGTDVTGTQGIRNGGNAGSTGVSSNVPNAQIGNGTPAGRNVISGNVRQLAVSSLTAIVEGNFIGTNSSGTAGITGNGSGILVLGGDGATIGGTNVGAGNLISGGTDAGAFGITISQSTNIRVLGNLIGTAVDGVTPLPNLGPGVLIHNSASNNIVGGVAAGSGNTIAKNFYGVLVDAGVPLVRSNTIRGNSIYANLDQGIRLAANANDDLASPIITGVNPVTGTACPGCIIEVFSDSEFQGEIFEGTTLADGTGAWTFATPVSGPNITATATDASNNTSQFSLAVPDGTATPTPTPEPTPSATPTPTATATLPPTATPTATAQSTDRIWGDWDCDAEVSSRDNQALLRFVLDQPALSQTEPCPDIGDVVTADGDDHPWGDSDCDGEVSSRDNQALLRFVLDQAPLSQTDPCPDIGEENIEVLD